jgi:high-affinity nickel-transport protein
MFKINSVRSRMLLVVCVAVLINIGALGGAFLLSGLGVLGFSAGAVAYLLGVRHAFDADHIAAIDNVTRRLRAQGQRPAGVGLFFSLGHSTVVLALTAAVIVASRSVNAVLPTLSAWGELVGGVVSAAFLTLIGVANLRYLATLLRRRQLGDEAVAQVPGLNRLARNADSSWKMFPLGMLFGLSFDTASEIALLALSIAAAYDTGTSLWAVMFLPMLFTAGMSLMDTLESLLMLRLYDWAIADQDRTLRLNTAVTTISVLLALGVAASEWIGLGMRSGASFGVDSATVGLLATTLLLGLGALAWLLHRRIVTSVPILSVHREAS